MTKERIKELEEMVHLYHKELKEVKANSDFLSGKLKSIKTELLAFIDSGGFWLYSMNDNIKALKAKLEELFG